MSSAWPLVSVIVPCFNHERFLEKRITSIFNQTYKDFEVILLDDASNDQSAEILKTFARYSGVKHLVVNSHNSGSPFAQWKRGIMLSQGDLIWIAESDDYCEETLLERLVEPFILDSKIVLSYCNSILIDENDRRVGSTTDWHHARNKTLFSTELILDGTLFVINHMLEGNLINNASAVVFKKEVVDKTGYPQVHFRQAGDYDFWLRILSCGTVHFQPDELNYFRKSASSVTIKHHGKAMWVVEEVLTIVNQNIRTIGKGAIGREKLRSIIRARVWLWIQTKLQAGEYFISIFDIRLIFKMRALRLFIASEFIFQLSKGLLKVIIGKR